METNSNKLSTSNQETNADTTSETSRKDSSSTTSDSVFIANSIDKNENENRKSNGDSVLNHLVLNIPTSRKNSNIVYEEANDVNTDLKFPRNILSCIGINTTSNSPKKLEIGRPQDFKIVQHIGIKDPDFMQKMTNLSQSSTQRNSTDLKEENKPAKQAEPVISDVKPETTTNLSQSSIKSNSVDSKDENKPATEESPVISNVKPENLN